MEIDMIEAPRLDIAKARPEIYHQLMQVEASISQRVDPSLYGLIKLRASQINGCAFCLAMHTNEALRRGETPERISLLDAWRESTLYSENERAALAWAEELTLIADTHASKDSFDALKAHFSDEEISWLILAAVQINSWNRLMISTRSQYDPRIFGASG
jgi:AhpD family alkylhydroperoxidase